MSVLVSVMEHCVSVRGVLASTVYPFIPMLIIPMLSPEFTGLQMWLIDLMVRDQSVLLAASRGRFYVLLMGPFPNPLAAMLNIQEHSHTWTGPEIPQG